jgi:hypothetical protein
MFCGRASDLDEFCIRRKKTEKRHVEYARNSCRDEFFDFLPHSYSHTSPHTSSRAFPQLSYGPNHRSYGFGSRENHFDPRCFGYGPRPQRDDRTPHRPDFPTGGSHTRIEPRNLDSPRFPRCGSHPTHSNSDVQKIVKIPSSRMVKYWIPKIYLTKPSTESSTFSHPM